MRTYAPNYNVPPEVSPFVQLPVLYRCGDCRAPLTELEQWRVVRDGRVIDGLCEACATT